jgi:hypothetical protein
LISISLFGLDFLRKKKKTVIKSSCSRNTSWPEVFGGKNRIWREQEVAAIDTTAANMVHIKKVVIQGFKSYKELLDLEPFSKGSNVIGTPRPLLAPYKRIND